MTVASQDFDDTFRLLGSEAVKAALNSAQWPVDRAPPPGAEDDEPVFVASPFVWRPEEDIPKRRWLYGKHLIRGFVSLDVAAGGVGKSSLKIGEALAIASGIDIYSKGLPEGRLTVWLYNLEDPHEEVERRIHATCKRFRITPDDLEGRLFVDSGRDQPLVIAHETPDGARIVRPQVAVLEKRVRENNIDVLSIDPFVSSHQLNENDNTAIDMAAKEWSALAGRLNISVNLVHHIRKTGGQEATAESTRGASALVAAARSVIVYNKMTKEEAGLAGIPLDQAGFHFRTVNDKANLAPPEKADWYRMNIVDLLNGDEVGVACPWQWPDTFDGISVEHTKAVQRAIAEGQWRKDSRAKDWVGNIIAQVLGIDQIESKARVSAMIKQWIKNGVLVEVEGQDKNREPRTFVEVGKWISE